MRKEVTGMNVAQLAQKFDLSAATVREICAMKGSPAYRSGTGRTSPWRCDVNKFEWFLLKLAERSKS